VLVNLPTDNLEPQVARSIGFVTERPQLSKLWLSEPLNNGGDCSIRVFC